MDRTAEFITKINRIPADTSRKRHSNPKKEDIASSSASFFDRAREIHTLIRKGSNFFSKRLQDYVNVNSFIGRSAMTDDQRELIEQEMAQFLKMCTERIKELEGSIGKQKFRMPLTSATISSTLTDLFAHQKIVVTLLFEFLHAVSQQYNEAQQIRSDHLAEQRAFFELSSVQCRQRPAQRPQVDMNEAPQSPAPTSGTSASKHAQPPPPSSSLPLHLLEPSTAVASPAGQSEMLAQENADLTRELTDLFFRVKQVENATLEIARLDQYLQEQMEHQDIQIQEIITNLIAANQNVTDATKQIKEAKQSTSMRRILAYMMFILGCVLLLYNWLY